MVFVVFTFVSLVISDKHILVNVLNFMEIVKLVICVLILHGPNLLCLLSLFNVYWVSFVHQSRVPLIVHDENKRLYGHVVNQLFFRL